ncbi:MAG: SpoIIE family protein phosphatase, partial [Solirubrobacterales bacterium]|nr:SpoIIE family protein phosphatase [Solirubrobacterales bacterium]
HLALLSRARLRSSVIVPLRVPSRTIGLMTLATTEGSGRVLNQDDLELAEQLGRRAAVAVENARLHTKLATVADTLQQSLTPNPLPTIPHMDAAVLYRQAETEMRIDVGGDFYEFFEHHGVWYLIFGDIAGKGVTAATITALMRHGARVACRAEPSPGRILTRLNEALIQLPVKELTTAICACLHRDHILISSAGHPSALLVAANGGIREAPAPGPLLGAFGDARWAEQRFSLSPEELLVLYTDGVTEAPGNGDRYGANRLRRLLSANAGAHPEDVVARLEAELTDFSDQPASDDVAVLALRTKG